MIGPCGARCRMLQTKHLALITSIPRGVLLFRLAVPLLLVPLSAVGTINGNAQTNVVVIRPTETQDELLNPGMGITTFQRFNGQALNSPLEWSERGPEAKLPQATTKPDFPDTSISYCRWYWDSIEPEPGKSR